MLGQATRRACPTSFLRGTLACRGETETGVEADGGIVAVQGSALELTTNDRGLVVEEDPRRVRDAGRGTQFCSVLCQAPIPTDLLCTSRGLLSLGWWLPGASARPGPSIRATREPTRGRFSGPEALVRRQRAGPQRLGRQAALGGVGHEHDHHHPTRGFRTGAGGPRRTGEGWMTKWLAPCTRHVRREGDR
jgi:hypothetical protein